MKARESRVRNCTKCNGNPVSTSPFKSEPFEGIKCDECFEILDYEPISPDKEKPKVLESKVESVIKPNINFESFKPVT